MNERHQVPTVTLVEHVTIAIALHEGYWKDGSVGQRNNNPGNLRWWGKERRRDGFVHFATPADGFRALRLQVWKNVVERRLTLFQFFAGGSSYPGYAPEADGNDPVRYASVVRGQLSKYGLEVSDNQPLKTYASDGVAVGDLASYPGLGRLVPNLELSD